MRKFYQNKGKRMLDLVLSLIGLIILLPVMLIVALLVYINFGDPIIFKQKRPGRNEVIFTLYKFRTMINSTDDEGKELSDEERLTRFGRFLRSTSLDELPSLFNILKGDMSIVGPRPLLVSYLSLYSPEQRKRHLVRPGLTGLAQVNGRNNVDWENRFKMDLDYIENISFLHDAAIALKTFKKVLVRDGITDNDSVTMTQFEGSKEDEIR